MSGATALRAAFAPILDEALAPDAAALNGHAPARPAPRLDDAAMHGLMGDIVRHILPHTEAGAPALLLNTAVMFGNCAGSTFHSWADGFHHGLNEFGCTVGETNAAKGTATQRVYWLFQQADGEWATRCRQSGLSSGEGLISAVKDPATDGCAGKGERRLFVVESEFGGTLRIMGREGNSLSSVLRQAWDGGDLRTMTKEPMIATGAHVSIMAHVTPADLRKRLSETDAINGFANRFLWAHVGRSKLLAHGGGRPEAGALVKRIHDALMFARNHEREVERDAEAAAFWEGEYEKLTATRPEPLAPVVARAAPHALRLSLLYAAMDCSPIVRLEHLRAALALWRYCEKSADYIFSAHAVGSVATRIMEALYSVGDEGLSAAALAVMLHNHVPAAVRNAELAALEMAGKVRKQRMNGAGPKPKVVYYACR